MTKGLIERLRRMDAERPKKIAVVGDTMIDEWVVSEEFRSQDGCMSSRKLNSILCPGGAANAAYQLARWQSRATLFGPSCQAFNDFSIDSFYAPDGKISRKTRYIRPDGTLLYRSDEDFLLPLDSLLHPMHIDTIEELRSRHWDAIALIDYQKGFVTNPFIARIRDVAEREGILVIADPKRSPVPFAGLPVKINSAYADDYEEELLRHTAPIVYTWGSQVPFVEIHNRIERPTLANAAVPVVNHVGAGDCFLMHLILARVHGMNWIDSLEVAHRAGRCFVQHMFARPPSPKELEDEERGESR